MALVCFQSFRLGPRTARVQTSHGPSSMSPVHGSMCTGTDAGSKKSLRQSLRACPTMCMSQRRGWADGTQHFSLREAATWLPLATRNRQPASLIPTALPPQMTPEQAIICRVQGDPFLSVHSCKRRDAPRHKPVNPLQEIQNSFRQTVPKRPSARRYASTRLQMPCSPCRGRQGKDHAGQLMTQMHTQQGLRNRKVGVPWPIRGLPWMHA